MCLLQVFEISQCSISDRQLDGTPVLLCLSVWAFSKADSNLEKVCMQSSRHTAFTELCRDLSFVKELAFLPLADDIPTDFSSVRKGPRRVRWRPDKDATVCWIEAQDEGDPKKDADPRDIVYTMDILTERLPQIIATTTLRCLGVSFCDDDLAILNESWWKTRRLITHVIAPDHPDRPSKVLFDRSYEDVYNDPGYPVARRTSRGTYVLAKIDGERKLLLNGRSLHAFVAPYIELLRCRGGCFIAWQSALLGYYGYRFWRNGEDLAECSALL